MAAAVIEFDALSDAVWPASQDEHLLSVGRRRLILFFIRRVQVRRVTFELRGAGIHKLINWADVLRSSQMPNGGCSGIHRQADALVRQSRTPGLAQQFAGNRSLLADF